MVDKGKKGREDARAEQRRSAFLAVMQTRDWTPKEWCERAGLPNSNAVGNFLSGVVRSLSLATLEPLAKAAGVTVSTIIGDEMLPPHGGGAVVEHTYLVTIGNHDLQFSKKVDAETVRQIIKVALGDV